MAYNYETKSYLAYARGVEFAKAAEILEESDSHVMIPQIVNAAFSCELLLKAVIIAEEKREKVICEHNLSKLFDMMDSKSRNAVRIKSQISDWDVFLKESSNACKQSSKISQNSPESIPLLAVPGGSIRHKVYQSCVVSL